MQAAAALKSLKLEPIKLTAALAAIIKPELETVEHEM
jgi:hypothetical protein